MRYFIITAIVVLAAAKAKAEVKDNLTNPERRDKSEGKRVVAVKRAGHEKNHYPTKTHSTSPRAEDITFTASSTFNVAVFITRS